MDTILHTKQLSLKKINNKIKMKVKWSVICSFLPAPAAPGCQATQQAISLGLELIAIITEPVTTLSRWAIS